MSDELLHELISAYIDGEVTSDERMRAEHLLATDAALRQYHDELLQLRRGLNGLPRFQLPEDFAAMVLRKAERTMLSEPADADAARRTNVTLPEPARPEPRSERRARTGVILAILSVAATFVVAASIYYSGRAGRDTSPLAKHSVPETPDNSPPDHMTQDDTGPERSAASTASSREPRPAIDEPSAPQIAERSSRATPDTPPATSLPPAAETSDAEQLANALPDEMPADVTRALPVYTYVVEVILSPRGIEQKVFETALERAQIPLKNRVDVDRRLESAMLGNRMFGSIKADQLPDPVTPSASTPPSGEKFDLVFVVARGPQIVDLMAELEDRRTTGEVTALMYDLAMGTSESDLAVQLNQLVMSSEPANPDLVRAHPLSLEEDVRSRLLAALHSGDAKLRAEQRGGEEALEDNRNPNALPQPAADQAATPQRAMLEEMEQMQFPVLYVLRSETAVRAGSE